MIKTFTLTNIREESLSEYSGKMAFEISDEDGIIRTVWGTTTIDQYGIPISITASKKREHPLIQCLFHSQLNETIRIEFTQYNDIFERTDNEEVPTVEELMKDMQKKPLRMGEMLEFAD